MKSKFIQGAAVVGIVGVTSGCANLSTGQQVGVAAGTCGAVGAIVGLATNSAGIGAAAGGGCFALGAAYIAVNYYDKQSRSTAKDQEMYGYSLTNIKEPTVQIRNARTTPYTVRPGENMSIITDYSVIVPENQKNSEIQIEESMVLVSQSDGQRKNLKPRTIARKAGGWDSTLKLDIPKEIPPGDYIVEHKIKAGNSYAIDKSTFIVASKS